MRKDCTVLSLLSLTLVGCTGSGGPRLEPINTGLNHLTSAEVASGDPGAALPDPLSATEPPDPWMQAAVNLQELYDLDREATDSPAPDAPPLDPPDTSDPQLATSSPQTWIEAQPLSIVPGVSLAQSDREITDDRVGDSMEDEPETVLAETQDATEPDEIQRTLATNEPTHDEIARLLQQMLLDRAADGDPSEIARLILLGEALDLPDDNLDALNLHPSERARINAAQAFARSLIGENATNDEILEQLEKLFDDLVSSSGAFRIREAKLCTEVRAFGDYSPIDNATFLAGIPNRLIVYTEPDRFSWRETTRDSQTLFEVEISQGLTLYHDAPGELQVWHQPRARIVETSRRKRRDFYLVNEIELPARLSVGSYLLKISTRDEVSGTIAERTIPIRIVADPTLAHAGG